MINGIIITARLSSSRLPGKVLLKCGKQTMIEYLISRLNISKFNNKIVVAIDEEKSDKLEKFLKSKKSIILEAQAIMWLKELLMLLLFLNLKI